MNDIYALTEIQLIARLFKVWFFKLLPTVNLIPQIRFTSALAMKVHLIVEASPNFMKAAPIVEATIQ